MRTMNEVSLGPVWLQGCSLEEATEWLIGQATPSKCGVSVRLMNAYCVYLANREPSYARILNSKNGVNFPDGKPVALYLRLFQPRAQQVRGPSLFKLALDRGRTSHIRHFFLGTTSETLEKLVDSVEKIYPGVAIAGTFAPPFGELDDKFLLKCTECTNWEDVDVLWVGIGTPKQDYLSTVLADRLGIPVVGIGAAFDFVARTVPEAPQFFSVLGLEWLYRLASEPRRLWKRYVFGNFGFISIAVKSMVAQAFRNRRRGRLHTEK
ncbi:WecB/TagA/CpsF family glycosyltransferase [Rarobacter incanus]